MIGPFPGPPRFDRIPTLDEFINMLYEAGWRAPLDAQHTEIRKVYSEMTGITLERVR